MRRCNPHYIEQSHELFAEMKIESLISVCFEDGSSGKNCKFSEGKSRSE